MLYSVPSKPFRLSIPCSLCVMRLRVASAVSHTFPSRLVYARSPTSLLYLLRWVLVSWRLPGVGISPSLLLQGCLCYALVLTVVAVSETVANSVGLLRVILFCWSIYMTGALPIISASLVLLRTSLFHLTDLLVLAHHLLGVYGPELCQYARGEDHADRRCCLLACV